MEIENADIIIGGGIAAIDYLIGKSRFKSNSVIDLLLSVLKIGLTGLFKRKNDMKFLSMVVILMSFMACSNQDIEQAKKASAEGIGEGISKFLQTPTSICSGKAILECSSPEMAQAYFVNESCKALGVSCGQSFNKSIKGAVTQFICKSAVKVVLPAILPSRHLPGKLLAAGCKSSCVDNITADLAPKICERL